MTDCGSVLNGHIIPGEPLVSVCVITYNHGKYIRQCLDGILMQKVNFPYEVLVHDDASPDDTADIIREYEARFPTVIKPIYQTENQYSQGRAVSKFNFDRAKGKYIAQCEGDDYWIDSRKLQMQVEFLEEHNEYSACAHRVRVIDEFGADRERGGFSHTLNKHIFRLRDCAYKNRRNWCDGHLCSIVSRNILQRLSEDKRDYYYNLKNVQGDTKYSYLLLCFGDIYRCNRLMATHRYITSGKSSWSSRTKDINLSYVNICAMNELTSFSYLLGLNSPSLNPTKFECFVSSYIRYLKQKSPDNLEILRACRNEISFSEIISDGTLIRWALSMMINVIRKC